MGHGGTSWCSKTQPGLPSRRETRRGEGIPLCSAHLRSQGLGPEGCVNPLLPWARETSFLQGTAGLWLPLGQRRPPSPGCCQPKPWKQPPRVHAAQQSEGFPILGEAPASQEPAGWEAGPTSLLTGLFAIEFLPLAGPRSFTLAQGKWRLNGNFWLLFACQCGWVGEPARWFGRMFPFRFAVSLGSYI